MRIGFNLPQIGSAASPRAVIEVARRAEALGFASLWVSDRLLYPVAPQTPYPASPDGALPEAYKRVLDPVATLAFAAAQTDRIALGTSVLNAPYYNPVVLARQLTALDVLSGGRLRVGLGLGWSKDELDAVGVSMKERGRRADEFVRALKAIWTADPVEFHGRYYHIPRSHIGLKPAQDPHPPIYLAAFTPPALKRAATIADGWNAAALPLDTLGQMIAQFREMAKAAGRDPSRLRVVLRAFLNLTARPLPGDRASFSGSLEQVQADVEAARALGVDELFLDPTLSPDGRTAEGFLASMERIRPLLR